MGAYYIFTCPGCDYKAEVSGGKDRGFFTLIQTMTCMDCSILIDVKVGHYEQDRETGKDIFVPENGKCPECLGSNIVAWEKERPCPKCDGTMEQGDESAIWD